jgi:hypothetical protein
MITGNLKVTTNKQLIKNLDFMLKAYYPDKATRKSLVKELVNQFEDKTSLSYSLPDKTSLILLRDERKLNRIRRYEESPLPFLSNIESFSSSVGE